MCADGFDQRLGRLDGTTADGLRADGSCYEELYSFGGRSFSIWTADGEQADDSRADGESSRCPGRSVSYGEPNGNDLGGVVRFWWRVFAAAVAAAAGLVLGLQEFGEWSLPNWFGVTLIVAAAVVAFSTATEAAYHQRRQQRVDVIREQARAIMSPLLIELEEDTGISTRRLGVAAYRIQRSIWPFHAARLERVVRLQLVVTVSSGVDWRPGVGVIGQCIARREDVIENLAHLDKQLADVTRDEWLSLPDDLRYGFSYDEYLRVRGKYGVVLATPVIKETPLGSRVIGCIAVDAPADTFKKLANDEVRGLVAASAVTFGALISGRR